MIYHSLLDLIGNTPLLELHRLGEALQLSARILVKMESCNPGGSVKDRAALSMIESAEREGLLCEDVVIIEPTSGNTGIGLAWIASLKGYRLILTMPDNMSLERRRLLQALGAELVLTPAQDGMQAAIDKAQALAQEHPHSFIPQQFENKANPQAHIRTTAEEMWRDTQGQLDILVAGVGSGGTLCGCARRLKEFHPGLWAVAVEPKDSAVLSAGAAAAGLHDLQGIGAGFVPGNYDASLIDEIVQVSTEEAYAAARLLAKTEAVLAGISSGAALHAAITLAQKPEHKGKSIVVVLPDGGERYLSTSLFG